MNFNALIQKAIGKAGSQDNLSMRLDLAPSALSKRINGEVGWQEKEINKLLEYNNAEIVDCGSEKRKIEVLKETIKIFLEDK